MPSSNDSRPPNQDQDPSSHKPAGDLEGKVSSIVRDLVPASKRKNRANVGGPAAHKNPDCKCRACASRRRKEEALARGDRPEPTRNELRTLREDALNANLPVLHTGPTPLRERIAQYVELRALNPGTTTADIARKMGITPSTLYTYITRATSRGWLVFDDPIERLDNEIIPKVLDNLTEFLDQKDRTVTIEAAKGTLFPAYKESKGINEQQRNTVLAIKFELPPGAVQPVLAGGDQAGVHSVINGTIVGQPKLPASDGNDSGTGN